GGLNINFPAPARDILAELNIPTAGCVHLDGRQGLAYVRSRHYEFLEDGQWKTDPTSDFGRINRQQDFIRRMIRKAVSAGIRNPFTANKLLDSFVEQVVLDSGMGTLDLLRLGASFRSTGEGGVEMLTIPTVGARIGGASVLKLKEPDASQMVDSFLNPPPTADEADQGAVAAGDVKVQVLNGSGRPGEAGTALANLGQAGFAGAGTGDAPARANSLIRYAPGAEAKAALLQAHVIGTTELSSDPAVKGSDVVLVTGGSFGGIRTTPVAPAEPAAPPPDPAEECRP
ncbi:MAG TPA: LCP family protein, partial [Actinomycetota bacterium]|nr:LCP family protein [Actinomycetota bacterium]